MVGQESEASGKLKLCTVASNPRNNVVKVGGIIEIVYFLPANAIF